MPTWLTSLWIRCLMAMLCQSKLVTATPSLTMKQAACKCLQAACLPLPELNPVYVSTFMLRQICACASCLLALETRPHPKAKSHLRIALPSATASMSC